MIELNVVSSKPYSPYQDAAHLGTSYELSNGHLLQVYKTGPSDWTVRLGCCKKANNLTWYFWKRKFADHSSAFVAGMERARQEEVNAFTEKVCLLLGLNKPLKDLTDNEWNLLFKLIVGVSNGSIVLSRDQYMSPRTMPKKSTKTHYHEVN